MLIYEVLNPATVPGFPQLYVTANFRREAVQFRIRASGTPPSTSFAMSMPYIFMNWRARPQGTSMFVPSLTERLSGPAAVCGV